MSTIKHSQISALLVDDDAKLCGLLRDYLEGFGFSLDVAEDASSGLEKAVANEYDVILLDMMLPDIVGLEMGADDYVPKAFSPRELLARVRAVLRRAQPVQAERKEPEEDGVVRVRGLWMDRKSMKARMDGVPMDLTALEFRILFGMAAHPGRVFTRENLLELAVGREFSRYDRSVDMHISTLRRKLGDDPHNPAYLKTIRGMGYTLLPEEASPEF